MLCFYEIRSISLSVKTSSDESSTHSSRVFPWNQNEISFSTWFELRLTNIHESKNTWNSEWRVFNTLELSQQLVVECILRNVVAAVWIRVLHVHWLLIKIHINTLASRLNFRESFLQIFCQIDIIREIKSFLILNLLDHLNVWFILFVNGHLCCIIQRNKQKLLNPINGAFKNFADNSGLLDQDQMWDLLELDISKHSEHILFHDGWSLNNRVFLISLFVLDITQSI
jgi:hypothetical protein